jgi:hypothetical protein
MAVSLVDCSSVQDTHHPLLERYLPIFRLLELNIECRIECGIATYLPWPHTWWWIEGCNWAFVSNTLLLSTKY